MKFGHLLAQTAVPEWSREYIDYKSLKVLIRAVTAEAVTLVRAYDTVLKLTDDVIDDNVQLTQLPAEQAFFERLEDQVANAESFYRQRLIEAVQNFFLLVQASIEQGLIAEFVPYQPDGNSRLVRELARLDLHCNVQFVVDRADDNSGQYRLPSMTIGMSAKDIRLPRFDDIVFVRRRARTAPVDARDVAALTHAAQVGDIATIRTLLAESSVGANSTIDAHGRTALFVAVAHEQIDAIALLLDAGADVARCDSTGRTPLDVASEIGRDDIVQMLLNEHSSGNVKDTAPHMKRVVDMRLREKAAKNVAGAVATRPAHSARSIHGNRRDDDNASEIEMVPLIEEGRVGDDSGDNDDNDDYESSSEDDDDDDDDIAIVKPRIQLASTTSGSDTSLSSEELKRANLFAHLRRRFASNDAMTSLQAAFVESYRGLHLLQSFGQVNERAVHKILKKHDKQLGTHVRESWQAQHMGQMAFSKQTVIADMMREMELLFALAYARGHRTEAMKQLRVSDLHNEHRRELPAFQFGLITGLTLVALAIAAYAFAQESALPPFYTELFTIYRGFLMVILLVWFWGLNMFLWDRHRVNFDFIFEFAPRRHHARYVDVWRAASLFTLVWALFVMLWALAVVVPPGFAWITAVPPFALPLAMLLSFLLVFAVYSFRSRHWLVLSLARILATPMVAVRFRDFFVAEQLVSLATTMMDAEFIVCFYVNDVAADFRSLRAGDQGSCLASESWTRPLIASLPSLWRIGQCCRRYYDERERWHIIDAARHATALFVIGFAVVSDSSSAYMALWITAVVLAVLVNFAWDVLRDWGLFDFDTELGRRTFVSTRSALYPRWWLYVGFASDLALRVAWALTLSPSAFGVEVITLLAFVEILRRAQWNMHRMANEQQSNIGKFRAIAFVPVPIANHGH